MPLYIYWCPHCRTEIPLIRNVANRNDTPICRCGESTERKFTSAVLRFRGDGWQTPKAQDG